MLFTKYTPHFVVHKPFDVITLDFGVVRKIAFELRFVVCKNLGNMLIVIVVGNVENGRNFGFNESRPEFDNILGVILNLWDHTGTQV